MFRYTITVANRFWLYSWFESRGVSNRHDLLQALSGTDVLAELRHAADTFAEEAWADVSPGYVTLAGAGLDLNVEGFFSCGEITCSQRRIDELFARVWHYFDRIVIDDSLGHFLRHQHTDVSDEELLDRARSFATAAFYIQEIGAEELVEFREKPYPAEWADEAAEIGFESLASARAEIKALLKREGDLRIGQDEKGWPVYRFDHPELPMAHSGYVPEDRVAGRTLDDMASELLEAVADKHAEYLTRDLIAAKYYGTSLAFGADLHERLLREFASHSSAINPMFQLELPILKNVSIRELLKLRADERESFLRFRSALKRALMSIRKESKGNVAVEIQRDLIEPELARISAKLKAAERALAKKSLYGISVGVATAVCGALSGYAALVPAGIMAALGTAVTAESKFTDDMNAIHTEDMYFLWRASRLH